LILEGGGIVQARLYQKGFLINFINKFYLTYFIREHTNWLNFNSELGRNQPYHHSQKISHDFEKGVRNDEVRDTVTIFLTILSQIKDIAEKHQTKFYIVLTPYDRVTPMEALLTDHAFEVLNLYKDFQEVSSPSSYRFKSNPHWNEEGNKLAAVFIFKFLSSHLTIPYPDDDFIEQGLYEYYHAFPSSQIKDVFIKQHTDIPADLYQRIRTKYHNRTIKSISN